MFDLKQRKDSTSISFRRAAYFMIALFLGLLTSTSASAGGANNSFPGQFVARMYTEGLGRAPKATEWAADLGYFTSNGCTKTTLENVLAGSGGSFAFNTSEFLAANPDPQSQIVAMYRAILNRDPDAKPFTSVGSGGYGYYQYLVSGDSAAHIAYVGGEIASLAEFTTLANTICGVGETTYIADYNNPVLTATSTNPEFPIGTGPAYNTNVLPNNCSVNCISNYAQLVYALDHAAIDDPVSLLPGAVIYATAPIVVPPGITVETAGTTVTPTLTPHNYTQMARIVRAAQFNGPLIDLGSQATLQSVWVDGQRNVLGYGNGLDGNVGGANIVSEVGSNVSVINNRIMEPQGGSNFFSNGEFTGTVACSKLTVSGNLITAYTSTSTRPYNDGVHNGPSDGLTMQCEDATIQNNQIVDVSDIAIVLFGEANVNQHSQVLNNTILSAGISLNAGISTDPITTFATEPANVCFQGTLFENNTLWTSPNTAFVFAIEAGARAYFKKGRTIYDGSCPGVSGGPAGGGGPIYLNNVTPPYNNPQYPQLYANAIQEYSIQGMWNTTFTLNGINTFNYKPANLGLMFPDNTAGNDCEPTAFLAESPGVVGGAPSQGYVATGTNPSGPSSTYNIDHCYDGVPATP